MKTKQFNVYKIGPGSGSPACSGSLTECLAFIRHYMREGADGFTITAA